jgi:hypothetical protein
MKKASILFAIVALGACIGGLLGQDTQKPYSYKFKGGQGDCVFTGVTLDQVWAALVKAFMTQDMTHRGSWNGRAVDPDRPSITMTGAWLSGHGFTTIEWRIEILVEQRDAQVGVYCTVGITNGLANNKQKAKIGSIFFDKVAELLYGAVEKK